METPASHGGRAGHTMTPDHGACHSFASSRTEMPRTQSGAHKRQPLQGGFQQQDHNKFGSSKKESQKRKGQAEHWGRGGCLLHEGQRDRAAKRKPKTARAGAEIGRQSRTSRLMISEAVSIFSYSCESPSEPATRAPLRTMRQSSSRRVMQRTMEPGQAHHIAGTSRAQPPPRAQARSVPRCSGAGRLWGGAAVGRASTLTLEHIRQPGDGEERHALQSKEHRAQSTEHRDNSSDNNNK